MKPHLSVAEWRAAVPVRPSLADRLIRGSAVTALVVGIAWSGYVLVGIAKQQSRFDEAGIRSPTTTGSITPRR